MKEILLVIHTLTAVAIIGLVLLQQGKGADMGAAFGSGASQTLFGSRGSATFLSRTTAVLAAVFFSTSLALAVVYSHQSGRQVRSVTEEAPPATTAPATTPTPAPQVPSVPEAPPVPK
jgi:preprotein translocase subunit SecG